MSLPEVDAERFALVRDRLFTPVVGDVLDQLGRTHQFLPQAIQALRPGMVLVGRAMPVLITDVFEAQGSPFGRLTEALDQLEPEEVYLARNGRAQCAAWSAAENVVRQAIDDGMSSTDTFATYGVL